MSEPINATCRTPTLADLAAAGATILIDAAITAEKVAGDA